MTILAGNIDLYRQLYEEKPDIQEDQVNWIQPGTPEYDELMETLGVSQTGGF